MATQNRTTDKTKAKQRPAPVKPQPAADKANTISEESTDHPANPSFVPATPSAAERRKRANQTDDLDIEETRIPGTPTKAAKKAAAIEVRLPNGSVLPVGDPNTEVIRVQAVGVGYYDHVTRKKGSKFDVHPIRMSDGTIMSAREQLSLDHSVEKEKGQRRHVRGWMKVLGSGTPARAERPRVARQTAALDEGKPGPEAGTPVEPQETPDNLDTEDI